MLNRFSFGAFLLACLALPLTGCNSSPSLTTIVISPTTVTVSLAPPSAQQGQNQYTAIGYYGHAGHQTTQDISSQVTWSSSNKQVATINSSGLATATGFNPVTGQGWTGNTNITASAPGFNGTIVSNSATFTVTACTSCSSTDISSVIVIPTSQTVATVGIPVQFEAIGMTVTGASVPLTNVQGIQWTSSVQSVATVCTVGSAAPCTSSTYGLATTAGSGTTTITATYTSPIDSYGAAGSATLTVSPAGSSEPLASLAVLPSSQTVQVGNQTANFIAIGTTSASTTVNLTDPNTYTVPGTSPAQTIQWAQWSSSNPAVASIDANTGIITAKTAGTTAITAIATNHDNTVVVGSAILTVIGAASEQLQSLALTPGTQSILQGQSSQLIAIGTFASTVTTPGPGTQNLTTSSTVTWASSNNSIATVTSGGIACTPPVANCGGYVTAKGPGTAVITAIANDNTDGSLVTATAIVTVAASSSSEPLVSLVILPASQTSLTTGTSADVNFIAIGTTASGATVDLTSYTVSNPYVVPNTTPQQTYSVKWLSSNPSVATFTPTIGGVVTPNSPGVATPLSAGTTAITAEAINSLDGSVVTASAAYTVNIPTVTEPYVSLAIFPASQTLTTVGQQAQFIAIGTTSTGATVDLTNVTGLLWSCSDANGKVVTQAGNSCSPSVSNVFTAVANGAVAVTASFKNSAANGNSSDKTSVTASAALIVAIAATPEKLLSLSVLPNSQSVAGAPQQTQFLAIGDFSSSYTNPGQQNMANSPMSSDYTVAWYSSNPAVAVVCNSAAVVASGVVNANSSSCPSATPGLVVAVSQGVTAITAVAVSNSADHSGTTATATFTVTGPGVQQVTALSIFPGSPSITLPPVGSATPATVNFIAIGTIGSTGLQTVVNSLTGIQWKSLNPLVATVDNTGLATALSAGSTTITVTYTNPSNSGVVTASTVLTVSGAAPEPLTAVTIYPPSPSVSVPDETSQLLAIGTFSSAPTTQDVTDGLASPVITTNWSSSNTAVATVTTVCPTGLTAESCTISACPPGSAGATCTTCPVGTVAAGSSCATLNLATPIGTVTSVSQGTAAIMAIAKNPDGTLVPAATSFSVLGGSTETYTALTIYPTSQAATAPAQNSQFFVLGTQGSTGLQFDVTSLVQWCSSNATVASIDSLVAGSATCKNVVGPSPGQATALGSGNTTFTAIYTNPDNSKLTASAGYTVTIGAAQEPLISINVIPNALQVYDKGQTAQFLAFGTYSTTPTVRDLTNQVSWYTSSPELATVDTTGVTGETGGLATSMGYTGTAFIYAQMSNPDGTIVISNPVQFTCEDPKTEVCDPGPATVLLATLTVYNAGENQTTWLITAPDDQGNPDLIHCGPGSELTGKGNSVCTGTYAAGTVVTLSASPFNAYFGGWSSNCDSAPNTPNLTQTCSFTLNGDTSVGAIFYGLFLGCSAVTSGPVNQPFSSSAITVSGGTAPYTFAILGGAGNLPAGLTLNTSTGAVTGTPTAAGAFSIAATDSNGMASSTCPITIN
jgi:hypothetical protein